MESRKRSPRSAITIRINTRERRSIPHLPSPASAHTPLSFRTHFSNLIGFLLCNFFSSPAARPAQPVFYFRPGDGSFAIFQVKKAMDESGVNIWGLQRTCACTTCDCDTAVAIYKVPRCTGVTCTIPKV